MPVRDMQRSQLLVLCAVYSLQGLALFLGLRGNGNRPGGRRPKASNMSLLSMQLESHSSERSPSHSLCHLQTSPFASQ